MLLRYILVALLLLMLNTACAGAPPIRALKCPVVACKGIKCKTPPKGLSYMSDQWRCIAV